MDLLPMLERLSNPEAYPNSVKSVELRQTHISVVCVTNDIVYKIKKPVKFSFLDFSSLEKRRFYCEREVELNRRLAPDVYLGVVPIVFAEGRLRMDAPGEPIEWAVKMRRLPEAASLEQRLLRDEVGPHEQAILAHPGRSQLRCGKRRRTDEPLQRTAAFLSPAGSCRIHGAHGEAVVETVVPHCRHRPMTRAICSFSPRSLK